MMTMFNRFLRPVSGGAHNGIDSFAPEFWRLVSGPGQSIPPEEQEPSPEITPLPPLTNQGLHSLRESLNGRANHLQDIPPPPAAPAELPNLTNNALRGLRNPEEGSGNLMDIPREIPRSKRATPIINPEADHFAAERMKELNDLRLRMNRLEQERAKPERARDAVAFETEIQLTRKQIEAAEDILRDHMQHLPGYRQI